MGSCSETDRFEEVPKQTNLTPISYLRLFQMTSTSERLLLVFGTLLAVIGGFLSTVAVIFTGDMAESMSSDSNTDENWPCDSNYGANATILSTCQVDAHCGIFWTRFYQLAIYQALLAVAEFLVGYAFVTCFNRVSENLVHRLRQEYMKAVLRQNIGWFDTHRDESCLSVITEQALKVQEATGEALGICIYNLTITIVAFAISFYYGWLLTLAFLPFAPLMAIAAGYVSSFQANLAAEEQSSYAKAASVAAEALANHQTVLAFSGEEKEIQIYQKGLDFARNAGKKRGAIRAFAEGIDVILVYMSCAIIFWFGTNLILEGAQKYANTGEEPEYTTKNMLIVLFNAMWGTYTFSLTRTYFETEAVGRAALATIYSILDRSPVIDSYSEDGLRPGRKALGKIEFKDVKFSYPSRKSVPVLQSFSLEIKSCQTVALVGQSGCGKSTILQLLQRFYDPQEGLVSLDGTDIRDLNLGWLREQIGVVSQEPVLFSTTIAENIRLGRRGVSQQEIEDVCRQASVHDFVTKLPNGYATLVGEKGSQLSGGQKQRIAIARALVRSPSILLLDEATSALDTKSDSMVQKVLDKVRKGRTTIIVTHRLSTIRTANVIVSLRDGKVVEKGTHSTLLAKRGWYHRLVTSQMTGSENKPNFKTPVKPEKNQEGSTRRRTFTKNMGAFTDAGVTAKLGAMGTELQKKDKRKDSIESRALFRILKLNLPEWKWMLTGLILAVIQGCVIPCYATIFGLFVALPAVPDLEKAKSLANKYALFLLLLGLLAGSAKCLQTFSFNLTEEALKSRLRRLMYKAMLRMESGWFDRPENSVGVLCARLEGHPAKAGRGAAGQQLGNFLEAAITLAIAATICIHISPSLGLVGLSFVPVVILAYYLDGQLVSGHIFKENKALEESSIIAAQAISNIRTVASLGQEKKFINMFCDTLEDAHRFSRKKAHVRGLLFGFSQCIYLAASTVIMVYGAYLVEQKEIHYSHIFIVTESLIYGAICVGQALASSPNFNQARVTAEEIFRLLDRRPKIANASCNSPKIRNCQGSVMFDRATFVYPTRPAVKVLQDLSFAVRPGSHIAIVGQSGSGKSTCVQLILRLFDPISGLVKFDNMDIATVTLESLRHQMAVVAQEAVLFDRSIAENIAYGDNSRQVSPEEIQQAAQMANIHEFVNGLPAGYETRVGNGGNQLSGGEKQRVAIARCLVKNPKLLLFDEATSALDSENEKAVYAALESAAAGRSCITITHRLYSIQNVDQILVLSEGKLVESGTHEELLRKQGFYYHLWCLQNSRNSDAG